ncbi:uncharacterized protein K444DRAFT_659544 [Hyaloscypha bicolor E]|uniref:Uncharacterized protein n=1 Tax=Hyaloscypha bicolor E TaxID=1095630 RepID=A0A2J6TQH5_9HELO|nr:uncharacterized protein K444DRAFT_659544 [Hyaloscypha bicolor E]PMD65275.1 hypothetical protein K444DRAFT_659544 [Hyaloscypha bicolor E]
MPDSPLSIVASVTGILTFVVAIILGLYARAQAMNTLRKSEDDILNALREAFEFLCETAMLEDHEIASRNLGTGQHAITGAVRSIIVEMYSLGCRTTRTLLKLLDQSRVRRMSEWTREREDILRHSRRMEVLRFKMFYSQILMLSTKIDSVEEELKDGIGKLLHNQQPRVTPTSTSPLDNSEMISHQSMEVNQFPVRTLFDSAYNALSSEEVQYYEKRLQLPSKSMCRLREILQLSSQIADQHRKSRWTLVLRDGRRVVVSELLTRWLG